MSTSVIVRNHTAQVQRGLSPHTQSRLSTNGLPQLRDEMQGCRSHEGGIVTHGGNRRPLVESVDSRDVNQQQA